MTPAGQPQPQPQRRNRYSILVTFPPGEPNLAGLTIRMWYRTEEAALLVARGFRIRGASA
jgi:hypothetical protein